MTEYSQATPAIDRALHDIDELEADGHITDYMAQRARDAVGLLFDKDTIYASIGPIDDHDVSFYWKAGIRSVSIDLAADGDDWASVVDGSGHRSTYDALHPQLRDHLHQFSEAVEAVNPRWREMER